MSLRHLLLSLWLYAAFLSSSAAEFLPGGSRPPVERIVLVYIDASNSMPRGADDYIKLAGHLDDDGIYDDSFFTHVLFLGIRSASGGSFETGTATQEDWMAWGDGLFGPEGELEQLEAAVRLLCEELGQIRMGVIVMIPRPSPDIDARTREQQVEDYVNSIVSRFRASPFSRLDLSGFYWMSETSTGDDQIIRSTAALIRELGLKLYWIPYFQATGVERWRELGFDSAMVQPNFAFYSSGLERFEAVDSRVRGSGLGVEMELPMYSRNPEVADWRESFLLYMWASAEYGWEGLERISYYYGNDFVRMSETPETKSLYDMVYMHAKGQLTTSSLPTEVDDAFRAFQSRQDTKAIAAWTIVVTSFILLGFMLIVILRSRGARGGP